MNLLEVKKGKRLQFINHEDDSFLEVFQTTDRREELANGFKIILNGKLIDSFKSFPPFSQKCKELIEEWELEEY